MAENLFSPEGLQEILGQITEIDSQVAAASGSEAAQRKAAIERIANENSDEVEKAVANLVKSLEKLPIGVVAGIIDRVGGAVTEKFQAGIDELVTTELAKVSTEGVNVDQLKTKRKDLATDFDSLKRLLLRALPEGTEQHTLVNGLEVPRRRGSGGGAGSGKSKSGKNKEGYRFAIDGKDRPNSQNTLSALAYYATEKCPTPDGRERWTTDELRDFLTQRGVKLGEDETWTATLPNGKVVSGKKEAFEDDAPAGDEAKQEQPAA